MSSRTRMRSRPITSVRTRSTGQWRIGRSRFQRPSMRSRKCCAGMRFSVRAPASSANLGPGFDALGLALDLWNSIEIETGGDGIQVSYVGSDAIGMDGLENYSVRAMRQLAEEHGRELPPFHLTAQIDVP